MEKLNRTPIIIASIIFAVGLWITVNLGFDYTTTKNIPLDIQNLDTDIAFQSPPPDHIRVRIRGEGWNLLGMKLGSETKYIIDLMNEQSNVTIRTSANLSERLRIPSDIEVVDISPSQFTIDLERKVERRIPIEPVLDITFRDGFNQVGPVVATPDSITVRGGESVIRNIPHWKTKPIELRDIREPVRKSVKLSDTLAQIVSLSRQNADVYFDVQPIAEKTFSGMRVEVDGVPPNREVAIIPPRIDLVIRGGINQLAAIDNEDFNIRVDYRDLLADTSGIIVARIEGPDDVRIVQRSPEQLRYIIRRTQ